MWKPTETNRTDRGEIVYYLANLWFETRFFLPSRPYFYSSCCITALLLMFTNIKSFFSFCLGFAEDIRNRRIKCFIQLATYWTHYVLGWWLNLNELSFLMFNEGCLFYPPHPVSYQHRGENRNHELNVVSTTDIKKWGWFVDISTPILNWTFASISLI